MSSLGKLFLLLALVAVVTALTCLTTSRLMGNSGAHPIDDHRWLHAQLGITAEQDRALDEEEAKFTSQRKELVAAIGLDNAELATAMAQDREFSPRVQAAVEKIHHAQSMLEETTLRHIFAMKPILTEQQFDQLLKLTSNALTGPADL